ncbi:MAG: NHLP bacteriocin system secretion protein [Gemmatimonadetes bacterium]|nr:NHLP bacteriocin system secretion protein [Gemmatimonadota bacterium]
MANRSIFRQAALDRLSRPAQLDRLMYVTDPRGWVALAGLCLVLAFALVWSVFGRLPTTIGGTGILLSSEGIRQIEVLGSGVVTQLRVEVGDAVQRGDTIAVVGQPQLEQRVAQFRTRLDLLREEREGQASFTSTNATLETGVLDAARKDLSRRQEVVGERIRWLESRVAAEEEALRLGLVTPEAVQNTLQQLEGARAERTGIEMDLQNNDLARLLLESRSDEAIGDVDERIRVALEELQAAELELAQSSIVLSPYAGYVRELRSDVGQLVVAGQALASVEMMGAPLQATVFVPTEGKRIQPGMDVQVSPVTVRREEYGYLLGTVAFVSPQPATRQGMLRTLGNEILVEQLAGAGAPFLVEVTLQADPETPSGFRWSSGGGPPTRVESGTLVSVRVVVDRQRPISLVIPAFRSALGGP